jgi:hypothetical protein
VRIVLHTQEKTSKHKGQYDWLTNTNKFALNMRQYKNCIGFALFDWYIEIRQIRNEGRHAQELNVVIRKRKKNEYHQKS